MTENEVFTHIGNLAGDYKCFDEKLSHEESLIICSLIEEIQQYRAIGTVEECQQRKEYFDIINEVLKGYSDIGTIEEFKGLKEKQRYCLGYRSENGIKSPQFD